MNSSELLISKNMGYVKKGIIWGLLSGVLCGFLTIFEDKGLGTEPFVSAGALSLMAVPIVFGFLQDLSSWLCVLIANIANGKGREYLRAVKTKPFLLLAIGAIVGGPGAACFYLCGVFFAGPFYPVVLSATFPAFGAILARVVLKEKIDLRMWCGILLAVIGAIVVSWVSGGVDISAYPHFTLGIIFGILAALGWAVEGVISNAGMDFIDPEVANGVRYSVSVLFYMIIGIPFISGIGLTGGYALVGSSFASKALLFAFLAGAVEGIGYYFYYKSCNACGSSRGMTLNSTYTAWSCIICAVFYREALPVTFWIGLVVIIFGGFLIAGNPTKIFSLRDTD